MKWGYEIRTWKLGTRKWVRFEERSHRQIFSETSCLSFYSSSTGFTPKSLPRQCFAYVTLWGWYETKMNMRLEIMFHCRIFELACINALQWRGIYASCGWSSGSSITTTTYFLHSQLWQWAKLVLKKNSLGQLWQNKFGNSCFCCCTWMIEFGIKRGHIMKQQSRNANQ